MVDNEPTATGVADSTPTRSVDSAEDVLNLHHVAKTYRGKIRALDGVSLRVGRGEIFGLLGPNGAGKSTLVKILMTVVKPSKIQGTMLGRKVGDKRSLKRAGYLPEHHKFPSYLNGNQVLDYYAALANVPKSERRGRIGHLLDTVGMSEWGKTRVSKYSKGMRQRLGLAQSLMNDPDIVFLDEPTDGVDPVGRRDIRNVLKNLRDQGKTVFLNSHLLGEVEMVCDRVSILVAGKVVREGSLHDLTIESRRFEITHGGEAPGWANQLDNLRIEKIESERTKLVLPGREAEEVQSVIDRLRQDNKTIYRVEEKRDSLEDLFMQAVTENGNSDGGHAISKRNGKGGQRS